MFQVIICFLIAVMCITVVVFIKTDKGFDYKNSISTTGNIIGDRTYEGGSISYIVEFYDTTGTIRRGSSQNFKMKVRLNVGDKLNIKYVLHKRFGIDTVDIRVQDDRLKEDKGSFIIGFSLLGIVFAIFCVISIVRFVI